MFYSYTTGFKDMFTVTNYIVTEFTIRDYTVIGFTVIIRKTKALTHKHLNNDRDHYQQ